MNNLKQINKTKKGIGIYYMPYVFVFLFVILIILALIGFFFYVNSYVLTKSSPNDIVDQGSLNPDVNFIKNNILTIELQKESSDLAFYDNLKTHSPAFRDFFYESYYNSYLEYLDLHITTLIEYYFDLVKKKDYNTYYDAVANEPEFLLFYHTRYDVIILMSEFNYYFYAYSVDDNLVDRISPAITLTKKLAFSDELKQIIRTCKPKPIFQNNLEKPKTYYVCHYKLDY